MKKLLLVVLAMMMLAGTSVSYANCSTVPYGHHLVKHCDGSDDYYVLTINIPGGQSLPGQKASLKVIHYKIYNPHNLLCVSSFAVNALNALVHFGGASYIGGTLACKSPSEMIGYLLSVPVTY
ncbi:MAG: hypothetical protein B6247_03975 [Candidatus Parabeggiatoa sp. nov. 2]|nr:MAG: hypothetical protein B6247_03975 [Beggiatoa sp. 4572_84]